MKKYIISFIALVASGVSFSAPISYEQVLFPKSATHTGTVTGKAMVTLPVPSGSAKYVRLNTDGTVSELDAATFLTAIGGGSSTWGAIGGTLSSQSDLNTALGLKLSTATAAATYQPLAANLTSWAGLATSAKQDSSAKLTGFAALANAAGFFHNDGAGNYAWSSAGVGDALVANPLSQFAAGTTSSQFAGLITNENGSGLVVFDTDPLLKFTWPAMTGTTVDITKPGQTYAATGNVTVDVSLALASGVTGQTYLLYATADSTARVISFTSCFSLNANASRTSVTVPASGQIAVLFKKLTSSVIIVGGDPVGISDLGSATPAAADLVEFSQSGASKQSSFTTLFAQWISNTAYGSSWNGVSTISASKDAVYDQLHIGDTDDDGKIDVLDQATGIPVTNSGGALQTPITTNAGLRSAVSDLGAAVLNGTHASPTTTNPLTLTATNCYGFVLFYGATGTVNLPPGVAGMNGIIYNTGAFTITIDANGSEVIVRDGTVQTGGVSFTLSSGAGNYVGIINDGTRWVTVGFKGTLTVGS